MVLKSVSLRTRSALIALFALVFFTPIAIFAIDKAYAASLKQANFQQLKLKALMLISEFEFADDMPFMPERVFNDQLNLSGSGVYGFVKWQNALVWQSASSEGLPVIALPESPATGQEAWQEMPKHFVYSYTAEFETSIGYSPVNFYVVADQASFNASRRTFLQTLWGWLSLLNAGLLICLIAGIRFLLTPLSRLRSEIGKTTTGQQTLLKDDYPMEITPLTHSINHLIDTEQQQRQRYKNSLSDLAHSLKTPLTVAMGETQHTPSLKQPLTEIKAIIERQLKRASTTSAGIHQSFELSPLVEKLINAMKKVYRDKPLDYAMNIDAKLSIAVEQTDLMECLGNLVDNACKAARGKVQVNANKTVNDIEIHVEDDGPGVAESARESLLTRGARLDTYEEGQGFGLALVVDIVASYGGDFTIGTSQLGGAKMTLSFPRADAHLPPH